MSRTRQSFALLAAAMAFRSSRPLKDMLMRCAQVADAENRNTLKWETR